MRMNYEFDGTYVRDRHGQKLLEVDRNFVKDYKSYKKLVEIDGDYVRDYSSGRKLVEFDGEYLKEYSSGRKIATIDDIRNEIDGFGGITLAAIWYLLYR